MPEAGSANTSGKYADPDELVDMSVAEQRRLSALNFANGLVGHREDPEKVLEVAAQFESFLAGKKTKPAAAILVAHLEAAAVLSEKMSSVVVQVTIGIQYNGFWVRGLRGSSQVSKHVAFASVTAHGSEALMHAIVEVKSALS